MICKVKVVILTPKPQTMEDKELEQKIITVMKFDGWCKIIAEKDFYKWGKDVTPFRLPLETEYHTSWEWIHSAWEKFRELNTSVFGFIDKWGYDVQVMKIERIITRGTPLEAFTALYEAIKWFNSLNKQQ